MPAALQGKQFLLLLAVALLVLLAWFGQLDRHSSDYLAESITNTGVIYGIARGINALVSMLQSSEVSVMLVSINIGELLDPLNDLIERFSHVLVFALAALALQKILLGIVGHAGFSLLLSVLAAAYLYSSLIRRLSFHAILLRLFLFALFLRFALVVAVLAGSLVDRWFLEDAIRQQTESIVQLENQLSTTRDALTGESGQSVSLDRATQRLDAIEQKQRRLETELASIEREIAATHAAMESIKADLPWYIGLYSPAWPEQLLQQRDVLAQQQYQQQRIVLGLESVEDELESANEVYACLELRAQGKSCSLWEWFDNLNPYESYRSALSSLADSMDVYVENIVDLLVSIIIKSILLPLALLFALYRGGKWLWRYPQPD